VSQRYSEEDVSGSTMAPAPSPSIAAPRTNIATTALCTHEKVHLADGLHGHIIECPKHNAASTTRPGGTRRAGRVNLRTITVKVDAGKVLVQSVMAMQGGMVIIGAAIDERRSHCAIWLEGPITPGRRRAASAL